ncbi:hypothetical protein TGAM01_v211030 [Trichoderma gamsii]|uniref:Uncharacterized protein n=1 Tax=Trichoderma gamsii TaxID=398673 RepID=A0A2P4Z751_9HYPO|nr:hypothetical protein TGAM01_v211030 [Trichoderma gamsii]PON20107.1 hypothetical protein TGAM01_v211030 [Trichoderma gamsii]
MDPQLPKIDLMMDPSWYWLNDKFSLDPQALFTTLHDRFNTKKFPLQDPVAFHRDVYECADKAESLDQFYSKLGERKAQRIEEMAKAWNEIGTWLAAFPKSLFCQLCYDEENMEVKLKPGSLNDGPVERWQAFTQFTRTMSFDSMVRFFDGFARDERKKQEGKRRGRKERLESFKRERAAERLAAAFRANKVAAPDFTTDSSPRTASSRPKSSRDASNLRTPTSPAATISDKPRPTSSSRRRGPDQPEALAEARTTEGSTRRKRSSDEDTNGSKRKKRRVMSEGAGDRDAEKPTAGQYKRRAAEATPTSKQAEQRKMIDDFQDDTRKKRSRIINDPISSFRQPPERAAELYQIARDMTPSEASRASSLCSTAVLPGYDLDMTDEERIQGVPRKLEPNSSVSTDDNLSFTTAQSSPKEDTEAIATIPAPKGYANTELLQRNQASSQRDRDGLAAKTSTISADTRGFNGKPRSPRRQRVDKRRSRGEQKSPTPKKQLRQRKLQEQNASPSVQQILRSGRASRRDPAQELWFLGDDGTTCAVASKKRN